MSKLLAILQELGKALDIPEDKLTGLKGKEDKDINEGDVSQLFKDAVRGKLDVVSRNAEVTRKKDVDHAYKAAERKLKKDLETSLREKFSLSDSDVDDLEQLVEEAAGKLKKPAGKQAGDLTDDDVKKHPMYLQLEKRLNKEVKEAKDAGEKAVNDLQEKFNSENLFSKVSDSALAIFKGLNPMLSADAKKAESQLDLVKRLLGDYKFQDVDGQIVILDKDGKVVEDELKNKIKLEQLVKNVTEPYFDFKKAEDRGAPNGGAPNSGGQSGGTPLPGMTYTGQLPKNKQEVIIMTSDEKIPLNHRLEIQTWAKSQTLPDQ